jgi:inner membrane protein
LLDRQSQQALDIERFRWFSDGYLAMDAANPQRIVDLRYSLLPNQIRALWGLELRRDAARNEHADYVVTRGSSREALGQLLGMMGGVASD